MRPGAERCHQPGGSRRDGGLQAVVVVVSGSVALLGDTLHNVADALTAVPLLVAFALRVGRRTSGTPTAMVVRRTSVACSSSR